MNHSSIDSPARQLLKLQELSDKQEIHEALMRYCRGVDRCDSNLINSAFHEDAVDEHGAYVARGKEIGRRIAARLRSTTVATVHNITNELVELGGDAAHSEAYFAGQLLLSTGQLRRGVGRYIDRFERRQGEWKIAHRRIVIEWMGIEQLTQLPLPPGAAQSKRSKEDPAYSTLNAATAGLDRGGEAPGRGRRAHSRR